ncbi:hypothetical protein ACN28S_14870 [Cystobacter fuscus]
MSGSVEVRPAMGVMLAGALESTNPSCGGTPAFGASLKVKVAVTEVGLAASFWMGAPGTSAIALSAGP